MPYDFTYMWNVKNKINEQAEQKQIHRIFSWLPGGRGLEEMGEKGERIKKYKLVVTDSHGM